MDLGIDFPPPWLATLLLVGAVLVAFWLGALAKSRAGGPPLPTWRVWAIRILLLLLAWILLTDASPTFYGQRSEGFDKDAHSGLRNAMAAAKTIFTDTDDYSGVNSETLAGVAPFLTFVTSDSTGPDVISWEVRTTTTPDDTIDLAALSKSGTCYYLEDSGSGTGYGQLESGQEACAGSDAVVASDDYWRITIGRENPWLRAWSKFKWPLAIADLLAIAVLLFAPRRGPQSSGPVT